MLEDDVVKKLRAIQVKMIQTESSSVSFSRVINEILTNSLKK
jgi:hypothetical protein